MNDRDFLCWIHERLENYGDSDLLDFMHQLRAVIAETPEDKRTVNTGQGKNGLGELRRSLREGAKT